MPSIVLVPGDTVQFTSKATLDSVTWRGTIEAPLISATIARQYTDIYTYHKNVLKADASLPATPDTLEFFLIKLDLGDNQTRLEAFSYDWATDGSLQTVDTKQVITIEVWDAIGNNPEDIKTVLKTAGYTNVLIKSTVVA